MLALSMVETEHYLITTATLAPYPKRGGTATSLATAWHFEPSPAQAELGDLCAVIEVLAPPKSANEIIELIIGSAKKHYYESNLTDTSSRFEATVKAVNRELAEYATHGNSSWIGKVSACLSVIVSEEVHITQTGSAQAYLYRRGHGTCITSGLTSKEPHRPSKTFGNIASGLVQAGDRLLLATPALFHQLSKEEIAQAISDHAAPMAIAKLHNRLGDSDSQDRIAATICEITTAEAAAMMPQTGLPNQARLGKPENLVDNARQNVAPLLSRLGSGLARSGKWTAQLYRQRLQPGIKAGTLALVRGLRRLLSRRSGRIIFGVICLALVAGIFWLSSSGGNDKALATLAASYHDAFKKESAAADQLSSGDKLGAKSNYQAALDELDQVLKSPKAAKLDAYLAKHPHSQDDPLSAAKLRDQISTQIDQIDGLTKVNPGQLADFAALSNAKPTMMEQVGNQFIFVDPSGGSSIYRYDLSRAKLDIVATHPAKLGKVVAIGASSNQDGVFLLTDQPAVWFYALKDSSLTPVPTSGTWPQGKAIASYSGNLYILGSDANLYKAVHAAGGYGAPAKYPVNDPSVLKNAAAMAVDGNIYIGNDNGFARVLSGVVQKTDLSIPSNLSNPGAIVSANQGKLIITTDARSNRIGLFSFDGTLQYLKQLQINDTGTVYKASTQTDDNVLYALVDQKFVRINY